MSRKQWVNFQEATEIVRQREHTSIGKSEAVVRKALGSGEVRELIDDGVVGMRHPGREMISNDDLLDWLERCARQPQKKTERQFRYASDAKLVEQGRKMVADGMSKRQAAAKLASVAEGGDLDQRAERLRKLI